MKKTINTLFLAVILSFLFHSCTKIGTSAIIGNYQTITFTNQSFTTGIILQFNIPAITQDIVDSGFVLEFARPTGNSDWVQLPYNDIDNNRIITQWAYYVGTAGVVANFSSASVTNFDFQFILVSED